MEDQQRHCCAPATDRPCLERECIERDAFLGSLKLNLFTQDPPATVDSKTVLVNDLDLVAMDPNSNLYYGNGGTQPDGVHTRYVNFFR